MKLDTQSCKMILERDVGSGLWKRTQKIKDGAVEIRTFENPTHGTWFIAETDPPTIWQRAPYNGFIYACQKTHDDDYMPGTGFMIAEESYFASEGCVESVHLQGLLKERGIAITWPKEMEELAEAQFIAHDQSPAWVRQKLNSLGFRESKELTSLMEGE